MQSKPACIGMLVQFMSVLYWNVSAVNASLVLEC